ncbi:hypothetical protein PPUN110474_32390 [Pseudomonas putida]|nr:hypothetical protein PPUN110474_32390 [Pseudomonas putida]
MTPKSWGCYAALSRRKAAPTGQRIPDYGETPVGAGAPANTGKAGAMHRSACFAGLPAPTRARAKMGIQ